MEGNTDKIINISISEDEYNEFIEYRKHKDIDIQYVLYYAYSMICILRNTKERYCGIFGLLTKSKYRRILSEFEKAMDDCFNYEDFAKILFKRFVEKYGEKYGCKKKSN